MSAVGPGYCGDCRKYQARTIQLERFGGKRLCVECAKFRDWVEKMKPHFKVFADAVKAGLYTDQC